MPYRVDARLSGRHPFEIFTLYFSVLVALPTVLQISPRPGSIDAALPSWVAFCWSLALLLGSATALAGIYYKKRDGGLIAEQLGLGMVGVANLLYAGVALAEVGVTTLIPAGIIAGYGVSCLIRYRDIQKIIDKVHAEDRERKMR